VKIILFCILAGMGAGLTTGFAGLSAAVYIVPILVGVLNVPFYDAVAIALSSDVLASAVSAVTYARKGNIEIKKTKYHLATILSFAVLGSFVAFWLSRLEIGQRDVSGDTVLGYWSIVAAMALGVYLLFRPEKKTCLCGEGSGSKCWVALLLCAGVGLICGFQGTGGGMMMLFVLHSVMGLDFKKAVGTSVYMMSFTALIGAVAHFLINGFSAGLVLPFAVCVVSTFVFAYVGARIANKIKTHTLTILTSIILTFSGLLMLLTKIFGWS